ncbi:hypothetical protein [Burkholderia thailandensis]|uniref:hypothetical protein n=1 Tax=Burkholderia thailandensis TaxID=57975 RepID=UPI001958AEA4|nr:hypothetical protein [Burkholderia thailandensis]MDD1486285.1 hypothetical protein [Burkholderia thailandensis]
MTGDAGEPGLSCERWNRGGVVRQAEYPGYACEHCNETTTDTIEHTVPLLDLSSGLVYLVSAKKPLFYSVLKLVFILIYVSGNLISFDFISNFRNESLR